MPRSPSFDSGNEAFLRSRGKYRSPVGRGAAGQIEEARVGSWGGMVVVLVEMDGEVP
ncbi:hypothetical protein [Streptomyces lydicus]|uniref:hypothetical protein n=1 Tax=Streptomyces lydicus TaxID=47763 RepID=UPI0028707AD2|nr:hypothetical protein [Streptomyces lydicus]